MPATLTDKPSSIKRFLKLLSTEKQVIVYVYIYAVFSGLVNLSLPLGIQSLISFVSGGQLVTSVSVLIIFIILGIIVVGGLQIMQLSLVELIQQRLFASHAFQFATRLTRMQGSQVASQNLPELMNRFFDVVSLQKGLAKILTDFSAAAIQIIFGLILLSFYHPYFIFFGLILIAILVLILRLTGPTGMKTSLEESKYKYRLVHWLEEMARSIWVFRAEPHEKMALDKTDYFTSGYLKARKAHFRVLITQYIGFIGFKTLITAGLLLMGSLLLVSREINLGQFVASEIIIILIITAVEKLLVKLDVVYDVLTSVEKLATVTELPVEETREFPIKSQAVQAGNTLLLKNVTYRYRGALRPALREVSLTVKPAEKICLTGTEQAGQSTLLRVLAGILPDYEGVVVYKGLSFRDIHPADLRNEMGLGLTGGALFEGTLLENITMGEPQVNTADVLWALDCVGLSAYVQALPEGLQTVIHSHASHIPEGIAQRLSLARAIARRPSLLLLDNFLPAVDKLYREQIAQHILDPQLPWSVLVVSNDPGVRQCCQRNLFMHEGRLVREIAPDEEIFEEFLLNK